MNTQEKVEVIKNSIIFKDLSDNDIIQVAEVAKEAQFKEGEIIFKENSKADAFYIIKEGEVEIIKEGNAGVEEVLAVKKNQDVFGEMAVIDDLPRSASIKAKTDVVLLRLSKDIFNELLKSFSHISLEISRNICSTVRSTNRNYIQDLEKRNRQLKYAYKKLKKAQDELIRVETLSVVGKFASLIIHDIKSPMSNIKAYSELISMNAPKNNKIQNSVKVIIDEVNRLNNMTSELLEFSRGEVQINKTPVNFSALISTMIDTMKEDLKKRNITIIFQEKFDCLVMVDIDKITRVFFNLISNAEDAIISKGKIIIKTEDDKKWIKWIIQDNGMGMEQKIIQKIFDPFYSYNKKKGTGLGMTVIKSIIDGHGGIIKVFSKKDSGTRFEIFLPKV